MSITHNLPIDPAQDVTDAESDGTTHCTVCSGKGRQRVTTAVGMRTVPCATCRPVAFSDAVQALMAPEGASTYVAPDEYLQGLTERLDSPVAGGETLHQMFDAVFGEAEAEAEAAQEVQAGAPLPPADPAPVRTYSLVEIRAGSGWPRDARFALIGEQAAPAVREQAALPVEPAAPAVEVVDVTLHRELGRSMARVTWRLAGSETSHVLPHPLDRHHAGAPRDAAEAVEIDLIALREQRAELRRREAVLVAAAAWLRGR